MKYLTKVCVTLVFTICKITIVKSYIVTTSVLNYKKICRPDFRHREKKKDEQIKSKLNVLVSYHHTFASSLVHVVKKILTQFEYESACDKRKNHLIQG